MRRAIIVRTRGARDAPEPVSSVTLPFDERHRRRIRMTDDAGEVFLLDLPDAVLLDHGDRLILDNGGAIEVRAASEPVADVHCTDTAHAARLAWHIGNRHTPVQVLEGGVLRIRDDHVLVAMVEGLGARVTRHEAPFRPEPGAYAAGRKHGEGRGHGNGHAHH
jgi:urease accessory protein